MRSKELKTYNLPNEIAPISTINAKPMPLFILLIVIGILGLILKINVIYCVAMMAVGFMCIGFMPRVTLMEFYGDYFVMYNRADKSKCIMIYYEDVESWHYTWSAKKDYLVVVLEDGTIEKLEAFSKALFESYMNRHLKDKHKKNK